MTLLGLGFFEGTAISPLVPDVVASVPGRGMVVYPADGSPPVLRYATEAVDISVGDIDYNGLVRGCGCSWTLAVLLGVGAVVVLCMCCCGRDGHALSHAVTHTHAHTQSDTQAHRHTRGFCFESSLL